MLLKNKTAIITGGSRGIGFATAQLFLENGANVVVCGSRAETVDAALEKLRAINPDFPVIGATPDLLCEKEIQATIDLAIQKFGKLDILVNNAGISQATPLLDYAEGEFKKAMSVNVEAVFNFSKCAAASMAEQKSGVILNTSSMVSLNGQAAGVGYPTSKYAVNGMTRSLARELGKYNIRVNAVAPGVIATDMVSALDPAIVAHISSTIPLGRVGQPAEIANAFLFLASDMASYVTGAILSADGAAMV